MDKRIKYLYKEILISNRKFTNNDFNPYFPKTIIVEKFAYQNGHNGDWEDIWQFDLAKDENLYECRDWNCGDGMIWSRKDKIC